MAYHPGMLNRWIELEEPITTRDATGGETRTWAMRRRLPAAILPIRGREFMARDHLVSEVEGKFVIRFQPDLAIKPTWRIKVDGAVHAIKSVINPADNRHYVELMAGAGVSAS